MSVSEDYNAWKVVNILAARIEELETLLAQDEHEGEHEAEKKELEELYKLREG